jgi:Family of unknown function (DUF6101)
MGGFPAGSSRSYRLDPQFSRARSSATAAGTSFTLDVESSTVAFAIDGGAPQLVPFAAYRGVAVRMEQSREAGNLRVFLDLLHADQSLTVPLAIADDPEGVVADWQEWGRVLNLPLLVVAADGTITAPLATLGSLIVFPPKVRRRPAHFRARRPRFLARRRVGDASRMTRVTGREIIAPE